jgi:hypothetical protein
MGLLVGGYIAVSFLRALGIQKERWQEARGVGIGTAGDAALEEISRVHRLVSRRSWKGSSLSDACPVHSVARSQARSCGNVLSCRSFAPQQDR